MQARRLAGPVVIVDALAGAVAGEVRVLGPDDLPAETEGRSVHGLSLGRAVALARALGAAPRLAVVGLGVGPCAAARTRMKHGASDGRRGGGLCWGGR